MKGDGSALDQLYDHVIKQERVKKREGWNVRETERIKYQTKQRLWNLKNKPREQDESR